MSRHRRRGGPRPHEPRPSVHGPARGARTPAPGARRRLPIALLVAFALVALGALAWWLRPRRSPAPAPPEARWSQQEMVDSMLAAEAASDGPAQRVWGRRLLDLKPDDPMRWLALALVWHNGAWKDVPTGPKRSVQRTSLDRMAMERAALALLDSAAVRVRTAEEKARIEHWRGQLYENLGLPVDGLTYYSNALRDAPRFPLTTPRATFLLVHLRDPLAPDSAALRPWRR